MTVFKPTITTFSALAISPVPDAELGAAYGDKTAGCVRLMMLDGLDQFGSVQDGMTIPPSGVAPSFEGDVAEAFAKYATGPESLAGSGVLARHPWRSRSSAVGEQKR